MIKISQIAIYVPDIKFYTQEIEKALGVNFYHDKLKMDGRILSSDSKQVDLHLAFDHSLMPNGVELELINSQSDRHWHKNMINDYNYAPFLSHLGVYCDDENEFNSIISKMAIAGFSIIQSTSSYDHSNKRENGIERSYRDVIFDSRFRFGFNLKLSLKVD